MSNQPATFSELCGIAKRNNVDLATLQRWADARGGNLSEGALQDLILEKQRREATPMPQYETWDSFDRSAMEKFSISRALNGFAKNGKWDGHEAEVSEELSRRTGIPTPMNGISIPMTAFTHVPNTRALSAGVGSAGGFTVADSVVDGRFIDLLRNATTVLELGATRLSNLRGNATLPKLTADMSAEWLAEGAALSNSDPTFGALTLTPHRVGCRTVVSKQLISQSSEDMELLLRRIMAQRIGIALDLAALEGSGASGQPKGLFNTVTASVTFGASPTYAKIVEFETDAETNNAPMAQRAYLTTPASKGKWKTTSKASGDVGSGYLWDPGDRVNGYAARSTNQISSDKVAFGSWPDLIVADWGQIDVVTDPFSLSANNQVAITINAHYDVGVMRNESFALSSDSGAQ